jgi:hypothetical protein
MACVQVLRGASANGGAANDDIQPHDAEVSAAVALSNFPARGGTEGASAALRAHADASRCVDDTCVRWSDVLVNGFAVDLRAAQSALPWSLGSNGAAVQHHDGQHMHLPAAVLAAAESVQRDHAAQHSERLSWQLLSDCWMAKVSGVDAAAPPWSYLEQAAARSDGGASVSGDGFNPWHASVAAKATADVFRPSVFFPYRPVDSADGSGDAQGGGTDSAGWLHDTKQRTATLLADIQATFEVARSAARWSPLERQKKAVVIQRVFRGHAARCAYAGLREEDAARRAQAEARRLATMCQECGERKAVLACSVCTDTKRFCPQCWSHGTSRVLRATLRSLLRRRPVLRPRVWFCSALDEEAAVSRADSHRRR